MVEESEVIYFIENNKGREIMKGIKEGKINLSIPLNNFDTTYLMYAASKKKSSIVSILTQGKHGKTIKVNEQDKKGKSALHAAAQAGCPACIDYIARLKPDVNIITKNGETPIMFAVDYLEDKELTRTISSLLNLKPDLEIKNKEGKKILDYLIEYNELGAVKLLVKAGVKVTEENFKKSKTPVKEYLEENKLKDIIKSKIGKFANLLD